MCRHMHNRIFTHCFFNTLFVLIFPILYSTDRLRISTAAFAWQLLQQKLKFYFPLRGKFSSSWVTWLPSALSLFSFSFNQIKWNNFWEPQIYLHVCFLPVYPFSHFLFICGFGVFVLACGSGCRYLYLNAACGSPLRLLLCNESLFANRNSLNRDFELLSGLPVQTIFITYPSCGFMCL